MGFKPLMGRRSGLVASAVVIWGICARAADDDFNPPAGKDIFTGVALTLPGGLIQIRDTTLELNLPAYEEDAVGARRELGRILNATLGEDTFGRPMARVKIRPAKGVEGALQLVGALYGADHQLAGSGSKLIESWDVETASAETSGTLDVEVEFSSLGPPLHPKDASFALGRPRDGAYLYAQERRAEHIALEGSGARREGGMLILRIGSRERTYVDRFAYEATVTYSYVELLKPIPFHLLEISGWEWGANLLVHVESGLELEVETPPVFSPSGDRFICAKIDMMVGYGHNPISIYRVKDGMPALEWEFRAQNWSAKDPVWRDNTTIDLQAQLQDDNQDLRKVTLRMEHDRWVSPLAADWKPGTPLPEGVTPLPPPEIPAEDH